MNSAQERFRNIHLHVRLAFFSIGSHVPVVRFDLLGMWGCGKLT
jgi:hypothetical protein